jgi:hypothetical protein
MVLSLQDEVWTSLEVKSNRKSLCPISSVYQPRHINLFLGEGPSTEASHYFVLSVHSSEFVSRLVIEVIVSLAQKAMVYFVAASCLSLIRSRVRSCCDR